jgi:hypothetical protein
MEENGDVKKQYEIANSEESWETFRSRYYVSGSEIALEVSDMLPLLFVQL